MVNGNQATTTTTTSSPSSSVSIIIIIIIIIIISQVVMPMTYVSEIGAGNRYQKTDFEFFWYRFSVMNRTMLYFRAGL